MNYQETLESLEEALKAAADLRTTAPGLIIAIAEMDELAKRLQGALDKATDCLNCEQTFIPRKRDQEICSECVTQADAFRRTMKRIGAL